MSFLEKTGLTAPAPDYSKDDNKFIRFWVKAGNSAEIIFLTEAEEAQSCYEHFCRSKGQITHHTCLRCLGESCPMCQYAEETKGKGPVGFGSRGTFFTVLDVSPFKGRDGNVIVRPRKRLLVAKTKFLATLNVHYETIKQSGHKLRGTRWYVSRTNSKTSSSVGDVYIFKGAVDLSEYEDVDELNYADLLRPSRDEMEKFLADIGDPIDPSQDPEEPSWDSE